MKKDNPAWIFAVTFIFVLVVLNIVFSIKSHEIKQKLAELENKDKEKKENGADFIKKDFPEDSCPDAAGGNNESHLRIKYFYSAYCPWCKKEEPILERLVNQYGSLVYIEWFSVNSCTEELKKYKISGVPTFVFSASGSESEEKEYSHYGFIYENDLKKLVCDVTGGC